MDRRVQHTAYCFWPFELVCAMLEDGGESIIGRATARASTHGDQLMVGEDRLPFFRADERVSVVARPLRRLSNQRASMDVEWTANPGTRLLPSLEAQLMVHPVIPSGPHAATAVSVVGSFAPPASLFRRFEEAMFSRRVLDSMVRTFVIEAAGIIDTEARGDRFNEPRALAG